MQFDRRFLIAVLPAVLASFGGGFLWGINDQRSTEAVISFTEKHIIFPPPTHDRAGLVFSCKGSDELMAYDLLNDEIIPHPRQIEDWMSNKSNRLLTSELFSHSTAVTVAFSPLAFSLQEELKVLKEQKKYAPIAVILAAVIPSGYLGYIASKWFAIECSTRLTYERLSDPKVWAPLRRCC
jgi:hypothetical protein